MLSPARRTTKSTGNIQYEYATVAGVQSPTFPLHPPQKVFKRTFFFWKFDNVMKQPAQSRRHKRSILFVFFRGRSWNHRSDWTLFGEQRRSRWHRRPELGGIMPETNVEPPGGSKKCCYCRPGTGEWMIRCIRRLRKNIVLLNKWFCNTFSPLVRLVCFFLFFVLVQWEMRNESGP